MRHGSDEPASRGQILRDRREAILGAWETAVRGSPVARSAEPVLRDAVRTLLERIAAEIAGGGEAPGEANERERPIEVHGVDTRAVLACLRLLRRCVLDAWASESSALDVDSVRALDRNLGETADAVARAVAEAHAALLWGVDAISRASIESRSADELLARLLDALVHASRHVTTVAVLLREGEELRVRATIGLDELRPGMSFRRASGDWSKIAKKGGVRATHRVALVHGGEVIGAAHMGSTSVDEFPPEDLGLFESMASRAALGIARHLSDEQARKAAQERSEAQALLEALFEAAPVGLASFDRELRYVRINRWLANANGLPIEAHIGKTPLELLPGVEGLEAVMARWRQILETGRPWIGAELVGETRAHPGERRTWSEDFFPVRMGGEIVGIGAVTLDVTEERRANDELAILARISRDLPGEMEMDSRLRRAVGIAVPVFADWCALVVLEDGAARHAAAAARDGDTTKRAQEMVERVSLDLEAPRGVGRVLREGVPDLVPDVEDVPEGEAPLPEGIHRMLEELGIRSYLSVPLFRGRGVNGALCFGTRPGRRFDERSVRFAVELARRISLALENTRLLEAARRESEAREQVLAVVSHDLRTPLSTILMSTRRSELAAPPGADGDLLRRTAESVRRAAGRMERLINDLLDVAAIQGGSLTVSATPRSPRELVHEASDAMGTIARETGISFEIDAAPDVPRVLADHDRVLQVLGNLVSNALKVTPPGGTISLRAVLRDGAVRFEVSDTGPGIPAEERAQLFEPYRRGASAEYQGTGLGLAISRGIVAAHGGSIGVESEPGAGATFWFTLPLAAWEGASLGP